MSAKVTLANASPWPRLTSGERQWSKVGVCPVQAVGCAELQDRGPGSQILLKSEKLREIIQSTTLGKQALKQPKICWDRSL